MNTGTESESDRPTARLRPSCLPCQRLKKKCDRARPQCSLCTRWNRVCSYDERSTSTGLADPDGILMSNASYATQREPGNQFPSVYFLDSFLFQRSGSQIRNSASNIDAELSTLIGNIYGELDFVSSYFTLVHPWIPILSKTRFKERVLNPLSGLPTGSTLLVASIKLVAETLPAGDARTRLYGAVKSTFLRLELSGSLDFKILQALILLALYEVGHGIYPAAYLTIGSCVRYGSALGIDRSIENTTRGAMDDLDHEEQRRSWWAILLLDRFLHLGCPERINIVRDPTNDSILPLDDDQWDQSSFSGAQVHRLSSKLTATMGRFCLTAQAAILLGRVFRNLHETGEKDGLRDQEARILDDTIVALTKVSLEEGRFRGIGVCSPTTICFSARLLLHDRERYPRSTSSYGFPGNSWTHRLETDVVANMRKLSESVAATGSCGAEELSPFCLESMYRSGVFYAQRYSKEGDEDALEGFKIIKDGIQAISRRWKVGTIYLDLLRARDLTGIL